MRLLTVLLLAATVTANAQDAPPADAFRIRPTRSEEHPEITSYLKYQTEMAWREDDNRRKIWDRIQTNSDLIRIQKKLRANLLAMLGGLPKKKTPLNPRIIGRIQMNGFHIEKLVFESLPGIYVTALLYVPAGNTKKDPAVLVPSGHSPDGKAYYQALCQRLVQRGYFVISWDPVGQGERSQFWDAKNHKSRYNLICAEHAVLGNLAYLAGTNLARWEVWDGIRAVDYLLTRSEVDPNRVNITGTLYKGTNVAGLGALGNGFAASRYGKFEAVESSGGWTQVSTTLTKRLTWNLFSGFENDHAAYLPPNNLVRNFTYASNLAYRLSPNVIVGFEGLQLRGHTQSGLKSIHNRYDLALAYLF